MTSQKEPRDARNVIILGGTPYAIEDGRTADEIVDLIRKGQPVTATASTPLRHEPGAVVVGTLTVDQALPGGHTFSGTQIYYGHTWP